MWPSFKWAGSPVAAMKSQPSPRRRGLDPADDHSSAVAVISLPRRQWPGPAGRGWPAHPFPCPGQAVRRGLLTREKKSIPDWPQQSSPTSSACHVYLIEPGQAGSGEDVLVGVLAVHVFTPSYCESDQLTRRPTVPAVAPVEAGRQAGLSQPLSDLLIPADGIVAPIQKKNAHCFLFPGGRA